MVVPSFVYSTRNARCVEVGFDFSPLESYLCFQAYVSYDIGRSEEKPFLSRSSSMDGPRIKSHELFVVEAARVEWGGNPIAMRSKSTQDAVCYRFQHVSTGLYLCMDEDTHTISMSQVRFRCFV